jgi:hypothetical protein
VAAADREPEPDLARLAAEHGYADQAHLTNECARLAGLPPAALLTDRRAASATAAAGTTATPAAAPPRPAR